MPALIGFALLASCSEAQFLINAGKRLATEDESGGYKVGKPYQINGVWYYPRVDYDYEETGIASWYGNEFHGRRTANGETFDQKVVSAAHRTLPLPSLVRVTNLENGRSIRVRINDRGPFAHGRILDMSRQGAQLLGFHRVGTARVKVEILAEESRQLAASLGAKGIQVAHADGGGPAVQAAPRGVVTRGSGATPASAPDPQGPRIGSQAVATAPRDGEVAHVPVGRTNMYVQAGAFAEYDRANVLRARLSVLGPAQVSQTRVGSQTLFRVRIGPIANLMNADAILARVLRSGHGEAQIVVDR